MALTKINNKFIIDQWRLNAVTNSGTNGVVGSNWERVDSTGWSGIGTQMQEASGLFTFPKTGLYQVTFFAHIQLAAAQGGVRIYLQVTPNNGTDYTNHAAADSGSAVSTGGTSHPENIFMQSLVNVTDVSNYKVRFENTDFASGTYIFGDSGTTYTSVLFERKGPSQ